MIDVHNTLEQMTGAGTAAEVGRGGAGMRREGTTPHPPPPPSSSLCWDAALKTPPGQPTLPCGPDSLWGPPALLI